MNSDIFCEGAWRRKCSFRRMPALTNNALLLSFLSSSLASLIVMSISFPDRSRTGGCPSTCSMAFSSTSSRVAAGSDVSPSPPSTTWFSTAPSGFIDCSNRVSALNTFMSTVSAQQRSRHCLAHFLFRENFVVSVSLPISPSLGRSSCSRVS